MCSVFVPSEFRVVEKKKIIKEKMSGWGDSNPRPLRPERSALTGLRYTPYSFLTPEKKLL